MEWLARTYVHAMNCIHYMHDKYFYERLEMALHDRDILRTMAFGIAGLSVVCRQPQRDQVRQDPRHPRCETGLVVDYQNEGNKATPQFGNNDDRVDQIASEHRHKLHGEDPQASDLPQRDAYPERAHHHFERGVRQGYRKYSGWPPKGRAVRARRKSDARPRQPRLARLLPVGGKAALQGCAGRHQLHRLHRSAKGASVGKPACRRSRQGVRRLFRARRLPHELERDRQGDARGCDEESRQIPATHDPRVRATP